MALRWFAALSSPPPIVAAPAPDLGNATDVAGGVSCHLARSLGEPEMNTRYTTRGRMFDAAQAVAVVASAASAPATALPAWVAPERWFIYAIVIFVLVGSVLALLMIRTALTVSVWSFSDALSEPTETTATELDAAGVKRIKLDPSGNPLMVTEMRASSSRMIALMGTLVILLMYLGFGSMALYSFANTGKVPESLDAIVNFMLAGLTLFVPYAVNKASKLFESLSPKKG
jgi:hypothetical protein